VPEAAEGHTPGEKLNPKRSPIKIRIEKRIYPKFELGNAGGRMTVGATATFTPRKDINDWREGKRLLQHEDLVENIKGKD